ncbi:OsmC family protein [Rhodococcus wratislaviensis]|uniref:OsmC family protein n=1 Tax=Rhodococcus wratislaviensis TaxID=44752 RepID=UPI003518A2DE
MTTSRREQLVVHAVPGTHGTTVTARGHELTIDEAPRYGGHDSGANPVEHLLAGIAAASLVVLRLLGEVAIAESAALTVSASLNVDRVMGADDGPVIELIRLDWEVANAAHAERLRAALPHLASRRPGQALIDAASTCAEEVSVRESTAACV